MHMGRSGPEGRPRDLPRLAYDTKIRSRLHRVLYVRDRAGLAIGDAPDLPPRLDPPVAPAAERASRETGAPVGAMSAHIDIVSVAGPWGHVFTPGRSCSSWAGFQLPDHYEDIIHRTFRSGHTPPTATAALPLR